MGGGGGKGGGGGSTTTVQKADPWEGQQPYLIGGYVGGYDIEEPIYKIDENGNKVISGYNTTHVGGTSVPGVFPEAAKLYQSGQLAPNYYPGQTIADQSQWTQQALQMQADRALNGSQYVDNAQNSIDAIVNGTALQNNAGLQTLNQMAAEDNPYIDELYSRANAQAQASLDSNFNRAGRYGSGAHEAASADAANNLAAQMYSALYDKRANAAQAAGQLYNTGIGQQVVGANAAQSLANQAYTDAAALSEAGGVQDDYQQQLINAAIEKYNYEQQQPMLALQNYNNLIQGNYGGTSTSNVSGNLGGRSTLGNVAGGAMSGAGLGAMIGGPWGAAIGGIGGGLLGLF